MNQQDVPYLVFVDVDGLSYIAKGERPYQWNFRVVGEFDKAPENSLQVAEFSPKWPAREQCIAPAVNALRSRQQQIRAEAEVETREIETKIQNLLCLEGPSS